MHDKVHEAVEEAIAADMTVKDFILSAQESWKMVLQDKERSDNKAFNDFLK